MKLNAYFIPCPEGGYFAQIAEISNVFSQGETFDEARENLLDALRLMTEHQRESSKSNPSPPSITRSGKWLPCNGNQIHWPELPDPA